MSHEVPTSDPKIAQNITQRLSSCGIRAPSRVTITSSGGQVTLSGTIQYEHQRQQAMKAVQGVSGVRRVVDNLRTAPAAKRWDAK
jgi:osmotically-inducible protein OsmY